MNKRFLSTLLTGAIFLAATSMFVSCKDYDDDIRNLQSQIDKAALQSDLTALQTQLQGVSSTASSALTKAEQALKDAATAQAAAEAAQKTADAAGAKAAEAITNAANAQKAADAAQAAADAAQLTADAAKKIAEAAATKEELEAAKKDLKALADKAQATADAAKALAEAAATKAEFDAAVKTLTEAAAKAQETADAAKALAEAAATKAEFDAAVKTLTEAAAAAQKTADEAKALGEAAATKEELEAAKTELSDFAKAVAAEAKEAALTEAKAYADELAKEQAKVDAAQDAALKKELEKYATNSALKTLADELNKDLADLKAEIMGASETNLEALAFTVGQYGDQISRLFAAIANVELFASVSWNEPLVDYRNIHSYEEYMAVRMANQKLYNTSMSNILYYDGEPISPVIYHGTVKEDSQFGDEAYKDADKLIEYKKGQDIKDAAELIIRVNPANADITAADIKLINSLGEDLSDVFVVDGAERFNDLLYGEIEGTRGANINSGLWKISIKPADGVTPADWVKAVTTLTDEQIAALMEDPDGFRVDGPVGLKKFAVAINNTVEDNADRYAVSTYDLIPIYQEYAPSPAFMFSVNDVPVNYLRNRWTYGREDEYCILPEQQFTPFYDNPELAWNPELYYTEDATVPATEPTALDAEDANVVVDNNVYYYETRRYNYPFVYADVNEEFVISNVVGWFGGQQGMLGGYYGQQIDYYYVVFDKDNAIESAPSEWNAWKNYTVEGLGVMTKASDNLTMKITSEDAHGDVVGFRVYAVNRDGTLADPDGRAFYVYVGKQGDEFRSAEAIILADKLDAVSEEMDVEGWFESGKWYRFTARTYDLNPANQGYSGMQSYENNNPDWVYDSYDDAVETFELYNCKLVFLDKDDNVIYTLDSEGSSYDWVPGADIENAVKVVFVPVQSVANMIDDATYSINIYREQEEAPTDYVSNLYATLSVTKKLPTEAKTLEFRPKQEGDWKSDGTWESKDGTGKFMAYMIPNAGAEWTAPWATAFEEDYAVNYVDDEVAARDNGYKDLNNIFYNLNDNNDIEFVFATSLPGEEGDVDLVDENGNGIVYGTPGIIGSQEGDMPYVLDVNTDYIDGKTEHAVTTSTNYFGVSTTVKYDKYGNVEEVNFGQDWKVKSNQSLTAVYACWHHAMHDVAWKSAVSLQWVAAPEEPVTTTFANITTKNRYNSTVFGLTIDKLLEKGWIAFTGDLELNTAADGSGQVNPYFEPTYDEEEGKIVFTQVGVQVDQNPTANHDEYLIMKFVDAFGHEFAVVNKVQIKKAASNAPRF